MLAAALQVRRTQDLQHSSDLLTQVNDMEKVAIAMMNAAFERNDEVAAAAWFDRLLKASAFRLSVESSSKPSRSLDNPVIAAMAKQERLAAVARRFTELIARHRAGDDNEGEIIDVTLGPDAQDGDAPEPRSGNN
ncbi:hypothetical protein CCGE525_17655 [Rhizobium jaguaris]|uniref:Uncharacterized protein n=2 Tax=Rhizobium jaguaris TaxID=1312183 RepID=A0A387FPG4_9HYPH|nr:hypothetical protein CCGE525_17655 [Rhizobium jaguaris]